MSASSYAEKADAEDPALRMLQRLGYQLLTPEQALAAREQRPQAVLLENILAKKLRELNEFEYLATTYQFSDASITGTAAKHRIAARGAAIFFERRLPSAS